MSKIIKLTDNWLGENVTTVSTGRLPELTLETIESVIALINGQNSNWEINWRWEYGLRVPPKLNNIVHLGSGVA